ncbi:MAG: DUF5696 domain-containing protein [Saccharofermentanales bacterium]
MKNRLAIYIKSCVSIGMIFLLVASAGCSQQVKDYIELSYKEIKVDENYTSQIKGGFGFQLVSENEYLQLYINGKTAEIKIHDKTTGQDTFSNPQTRDTDRLTRNVPSRQKLISQINVDYEADKGLSYMNSYTDAIDRDQYNYQKVDGGIRVNFVIGEKPVVYLAPQILSIERHDEIYNKLTAADKKLMDKYYKLIKLSQFVNDEDRALRRQQYPILAERDVYISNLSTSGVALGEQEYASTYVMSKVNKMFKSIGYTFDDLERDNAENKVPPLDQDDLTVSVSVVYKLDGNSFVATIPKDSIYFNRDDMQVTHLTLLPYFGAADEKKKGYMFVPDGSGALINLANNKKIYGTFNKPVYGRDKLVYTDELTITDSMMPLPVFGIKGDDEAFLGIIEEGDGVATIIADISGKISQNNSVHAKFLINANSIRSSSGLSSGLGKKYQNELLDSNLSMRYYFMKGDKANYSGMAQRYRQYLLDTNKIKKQAIPEKIPVSISTVQSINYRKSVLGVPREQILPLTTFEQTRKILEELKAKGINDLILQISNWSNNAALNTPFNKVSILKEIGGKSGFNDLVQYTRENKIDFYPMTNFQYISRNKWFSGFDSRKNSSRMLDNTIAYDYYYSINTLIKSSNRQKNIVSPLKYSKLLSSYVDSYSSYNNPFISLGSMGTDLNPDYSNKGSADRQETIKIMQDQVKFLNNKGMKVAVTGGNIYAVNGVSFINNAPNMASNEYICDESIPFYQMVMHGLIPYTGPVLNTSSDYRKDVLRLVESGSYPSFEWIFETNDVLMDTDSNFYSINYKDWVDDALEVYKIMNDTPIAKCADAAIIKHTILQKDLVKVEYDNGITIYVNYSSEKLTADGIGIEAEDYVIKGGE